MSEPEVPPAVRMAYEHMQAIVESAGDLPRWFAYARRENGATRFVIRTKEDVPPSDDPLGQDLRRYLDVHDPAKVFPLLVEQPYITICLIPRPGVEPDVARAEMVRVKRVLGVATTVVEEPKCG